MSKRTRNNVIILLLIFSIIWGNVQTASASGERTFLLGKVKTINWTNNKMTFYGKLRGKYVTYNKKKSFKLSKNFRCRVADPEVGWYTVPKKDFKSHLFCNQKNGKIDGNDGYLIRVKNNQITAICYSP